MFIWAMLFDATGNNLLLGVVPESLGLLIFGALLIGFAASLRRILKRDDETDKEEEKTFSVQTERVSEEV